MNTSDTEILALSAALDDEARGIWAAMGRALLMTRTPRLTLVPRPGLHAVENSIGSGVESAPPKLVSDAVGG